MSELLARDFFRALFHTGRRMTQNPVGDPALDWAVGALHAAAEVLTASGDEAVISVVGDAFYLGRDVLANTSTEFDSLLQAMKQRRIETITIRPGATPSDLADLATLVAGWSDDLPAGGTVLLNERSASMADVDVQPLSTLRRAYSESLDALRGVSRSRTLHLVEVLDVVDAFLDGAAADPGSSLLMATVHNHDELTYYHSINVCLLALSLGRFIGMDRAHLRMLGLSAMLHDVGRVVVDEAALHNKGRLSNEEWAQVRLHPQEGALAILSATGPGQEVAAAVALEHHVRVDGGGYPDLRGRRPHIYSRIVAVADTYEAVTAHRPYRPARTPSKALRLLLEGAGTVHDADMVRLFIGMMGTHPPGSLLRLEGGEVVVVVTTEGDGRRGIVVRESDGSDAPGDRIIDFGADDVAAHLLPSDVGVDPGSLLEVVERHRAAV